MDRDFCRQKLFVLSEPGGTENRERNIPTFSMLRARWSVIFRSKPPQKFPAASAVLIQSSSRVGIVFTKKKERCPLKITTESSLNRRFPVNDWTYKSVSILTAWKLSQWWQTFFPRICLETVSPAPRIVAQLSKIYYDRWEELPTKTGLHKLKASGFHIVTYTWSWSNVFI